MPLEDACPAVPIFQLRCYVLAAAVYFTHPLLNTKCSLWQLGHFPREGPQSDLGIAMHPTTLQQWWLVQWWAEQYTHVWLLPMLFMLWPQSRQSQYLLSELMVLYISTQYYTPADFMPFSIQPCPGLLLFTTTSTDDAAISPVCLLSLTVTLFASHHTCVGITSPLFSSSNSSHIFCRPSVHLPSTIYDKLHESSAIPIAHYQLQQILRWRQSFLQWWWCPITAQASPLVHSVVKLQWSPRWHSSWHWWL